MRSLLFALLIISGLVAAIGYGFSISAQSGGTEAPGRVLYVANCAGCHGVSLEGQPEWMKRLPNGRLPAPPHDEAGHTWHHSDRQLFTIVKSGLAAIAPGYESDMPVFEGVLSDEQIVEVLHYIRSTWSDRARAYQADRSTADPM
jgi:mono/diheme cytochrome c family protein